MTSLPAVTSAERASASGGAGDEGGILRAAMSPFRVDVDGLRVLHPDLILTQTQCDVCAVTEAQLRESLSETLKTSVDLFSMTGSSFQDVLKDALALGRKIGRGTESMTVLGKGERRVRELRGALGLDRRTPVRDLPTVAVIEWFDPVMTAGHWTPDLVELAGGRPVCAKSRSMSEVIEWDVILRANPDFIALVPCGMSLSEGRKAAEALMGRMGWEKLEAVRQRRVFLFDGRAYFNRPGPRLYRSVELLAGALYGKRAGIDAASHEVVRL